MSDQQYQQQGNTQGINPGKGLSIASMILGIISLVIPYAGTAVAIVGLILGIVGKKKSKAVNAPSGMATAGIVMSIIAIAWSVALIAICASCVGWGVLSSL